jgi:hypothetical protein
VLRNGAQNGVQSTGAALVCRYSDAVRRWFGGLSNDVASNLVHKNVLPTLAKDVSELLT